MATKSGGKVGACSMALSLILLMALVSSWSPRAALAESMEDIKNRANLAAEKAKAKASEAVLDFKEATRSWTDWGSDKITKALELRHENAKVAADRTMETVKDEPSTSKNEIYSAASVAAEMAGEVKAAMMDKTGDTTTDEANHDSAYEGAKKRVSDAYETAKGAMTEGARANYEAAKEKSSQAAGDVGAKMQGRSAEL